MSKDLKWDYNKFREFDKFIHTFKTYQDLSKFLEENLSAMSGNQEFLYHIVKMTPQEQLLLFYLKKYKGIKNLETFYKEYIKFCQEYYYSLNKDLFEVDPWKRQAIYHINRKNRFLESLK
ncbi:MAG: hypothetical protein ACRCW8_11005, partial [Cetobacterium sp.]